MPKNEHIVSTETTSLLQKFYIGALGAPRPISLKKLGFLIALPLIVGCAHTLLCYLLDTEKKFYANFFMHTIMYYMAEAGCVLYASGSEMSAIMKLAEKAEEIGKIQLLLQKNVTSTKLKDINVDLKKHVDAIELITGTDGESLYHRKIAQKILAYTKAFSLILDHVRGDTSFVERIVPTLELFKQMLELTKNDGKHFDTDKKKFNEFVDWLYDILPDDYDKTRMYAIVDRVNPPTPTATPTL